VPLLDELAESLGVDETAARQLAAHERRQAIEYAEGVLEIVEGSRSLDFEDDAEEEVLSAGDVVDARGFVERHEVGDTRTAAQRAAEDRTWVFGHVIVDEAQELSAMAWRTLMRRCPSKSMTVVGDIAQTGDIGGATSWDTVLSPYVQNRWRLTELSVNYRTPAEIMEVAADVLASVDSSLVPPTSVRETGVPPWVSSVSSFDAEVPALIASEVTAVGDGKVAVIVPAALLSSVGTAIVTGVPGSSLGNDLEEAQIVVLGVTDAKGLEFDSVVVVDPAGIVEESPRGASDLYVALTRATQRLGVVHTGTLPDVLSRLKN
jgi:DNA helicase IV